MATRLERPLKKLATVAGPVAIGVFEDGTFIVAGPNDKPLLLRHGAVMETVEYAANGDLTFQYTKQD